MNEPKVVRTASKDRPLSWRSRMSLRQSPLAFVVAAIVVLMAPRPVSCEESRSTAFAAANDAAMAKMMTGMRVQSSGDVDRDFVAAMTPHHQSAIDMAEAELRYGRNERLRRIARGIVVAQKREITAMHTALEPATALAPRSATPMHAEP